MWSIISDHQRVRGGRKGRRGSSNHINTCENPHTSTDSCLIEDKCSVQPVCVYVRGLGSQHKWNLRNISKLAHKNSCELTCTTVHTLVFMCEHVKRLYKPHRDDRRGLRTVSTSMKQILSDVTAASDGHAHLWGEHVMSEHTEAKRSHMSPRSEHAFNSHMRASCGTLPQSMSLNMYLRL